MELFGDQKDVGLLLHPGAASFDRKTKTYTLSASGENMWAAKDAFHFLYTQGRGDLAISADISFVGNGTDKHRKACLMFRQDLEPDSAYIDVALHGDGLTSLQFRETKGALTHEIQANLIAPHHFRLEKRGPSIYLHLESRFSGASHRMTLQDPFYVGLAVCSHNKDVTETARFSNVVIETKLPSTQPTPYITLETQSIASTDRRTVFVTKELIESPAWTLDGTSLLFTLADQRYVISAIVPGSTPQKTSISAVGIVPSLTSPDQKRTLSITPSSDATINSLRLSETTLLANLTAAPGLSHQPCWSPDSKKIAFISYHAVP